MTDGPDQRRGPGLFRGMLAGNGWAMLALAGLTVMVEGLAFGGAWLHDPRLQSATLVTLGVMTWWVALAAPTLAAGGRNNLSALLRGGVVIDATGLVLLGLWLAGKFSSQEGALSLWRILRIYLVLASVGLAGIAGVCLWRSTVARAAGAMVMATIFVVALCSPLWIGGWLGQGDVTADQALADWAVRINPFYAITIEPANAKELGFVWHTWGWMYEWSHLGDYVNPGKGRWYSTAAIYAALAMVLAGVGCLRYVRRPSRDKAG